MVLGVMRCDDALWRYQEAVWRHTFGLNREAIVESCTVLKSKCSPF